MSKLKDDMGLLEQDDFEPIFKRTAELEGGFTVDEGGPTNPQLTDDMGLLDDDIGLMDVPKLKDDMGLIGDPNEASENRIGELTKKFVEEAFAQPWHSFNSSIQRGFANTLRPIAGAYDFYADKLKMGDPDAKRWLEKATEEYDRIAIQEQQKGILPKGFSGKLAKGVYEGLGGAFIEIPKYMAGSAALAPAGLGFAGMGAVGFMEATPEGTGKAVEAGVQGLAFQQYVKAISVLPRSIQLPTAFSVFAGSTKLNGGTPEESLASGILGVGLTLTGRAPSMKEFRSRYAKNPHAIENMMKQSRRLNKAKSIWDYRAWKKDATKVMDKYGNTKVLESEVQRILAKSRGGKVAKGEVKDAVNKIRNVWAKQVSDANARKIGGLKLLTPQEMLGEGIKLENTLKTIPKQAVEQKAPQREADYALKEGLVTKKEVKKAYKKSESIKDQIKESKKVFAEESNVKIDKAVKTGVYSGLTMEEFKEVKKREKDEVWEEEREQRPEKYVEEKGDLKTAKELGISETPITDAEGKPFPTKVGPPSVEMEKKFREAQEKQPKQDMIKKAREKAKEKKDGEKVNKLRKFADEIEKAGFTKIHSKLSYLENLAKKANFTTIKGFKSYIDLRRNKTLAKILKDLDLDEESFRDLLTGQELMGIIRKELAPVKEEKKTHYPEYMPSSKKGDLEKVREQQRKDKEKAVTSISKSVRDHTQRAIIDSDNITIENRSGRKMVKKVSFPISKWEELEKSFGNPNFNKREFVKTLDSFIVDDTPEGHSLGERILDSQISAINKAYKDSIKDKVIEKEKPIIQGVEKVSKETLDEFIKEGEKKESRIPKLVDGFIKSLNTRTLPNKPKELRALAEKLVGGDSKEYYDEIYDALEMALNKTAFIDKDDIKKGFEFAQMEEDRLPLRQRSLETIKRQQFSTPLTLATAANYALDVQEGDVLLEPTAGTGNLIIPFKKEGVKYIANELDEILEETYRNYATDNIHSPGDKKDVIQNIRSNLSHPQLNTGFSEEDVSKMSDEEVFNMAKDSYERKQNLIHKKTTKVKESELLVDKRKFNKGKNKTEADLANSGKLSSIMRKSKEGIRINDEILNNFEKEDHKYLKKRSKKDGKVDFNSWASELRQNHPILANKSDMEIAQMVIDQEKGLVKDIEKSEAQLDKEYNKWKKNNPDVDVNTIIREEKKTIEQEKWDEEDIERYITGEEIDKKEVVDKEVEKDAEGERSLEEEAKKYKSVEEWIKNKPKVFHTSQPENIKNIEEKGVIAEIGKGQKFKNQYGFSVAKNKPIGVKNPSIEFVIDEKAKIAKGKDIPDRFFETLSDGQVVFNGKDVIPWAKEQGYDGIDLDEITITRAKFKTETPYNILREIQIFNPKVLKTKQQLTDIWNKAQEGNEKENYEKTKIDEKGKVEEAKIAYGSEDKEIQAIKETADRARSVRSTSGVQKYSDIGKKLEKQGYIDTIGTKISNAQDVAELATIFRDPQIEKLQIIYIKDGEVVAHNVLTSGKPYYVDIKYLARFKQRIVSAYKRLGATEVYVSHNHPVGDPKASDQDIGFTKNLGYGLQKAGIKLSGHVIIDHDKYAFINADTLSKGKGFEYRTYKSRKEKFTRETEAFRYADDVFKATKDYGQKGKVSILFLDNGNRLISVDNIGKDKNISQYVKERMSTYKASSYMISTFLSDNVDLRRLPNGLLDIIKMSDDGMKYGALSEGSFSRPSIEKFEPKSAIRIQEEQMSFFEKEGEKEHGLSKSVERDAIEKGFIEEFEGIPTYTVRNMKEVADKALTFIYKNKKLAKKIAMGEAPEKGDVRASELYTALRIKAFMEGDLDTIEDLAFSKTAISMATELGQRIKAYDSKLEFDPVRSIQEVIKIRKEFIQKKSKNTEELERKLAETEEKLKKLETEIEAKKQAAMTKGARKFGRDNKIFTQSKLDEAREALRKKMANLPKRVEEERPTYGKKKTEDEGPISELVTIGGFYFEGGYRDYEMWASTLQKEFGSDIKPYLKDVWNEVLQEYVQGTRKIAGEKIAKIAAQGDPMPKRYVVQQIAEDLIDGGILGRDDLVREMTDILQDSYPNITERETADLISGYGQYSKLSEDAVKVILRDIKGQLQQVSKLEDLQEGIAPAKTGVERRTPSDEERRLIKLVEQAKKKYNIKTTDPETQLKSALDSYKTKLRNQIKDLGDQIKTKQKIIKEKYDLKLDAEAESLKAKRDALRKTFNDIFGRPGISEATRIKLAEKILNRSIEIYEKKIKEGDISPITKKKEPVSTPKLEELRAKRDALKGELNKIRDMAKPKKSPEEISLQALKTRLYGEIKRIENRLERLDFETKRKREVELDAEAEKLRTERDRIKTVYNASKYVSEGITKTEVKNITEKAKLAYDALEKVRDKGDWTADNAKDVEDFFYKKSDFEDYVENLKPQTIEDNINKFIDYMRASILASPRILRNSFLYQIIPGIERTITKRIVTGVFNDADLKSNIYEKLLAKLSGIKPSAKSLDFMRRQMMMTIRIYHRTGIDISRQEKLDKSYKMFGEKVRKFTGSSALEKYARAVNLGPKWMAGGTDMLFASIGRADTCIMLSKERAKIESLKGILPKGMTEKERADYLLKESYSFEPQDPKAEDIRNEGIRDAHAMNNTQAGWWSDKVIEMRRIMRIGKINFGKLFIPFAKIANVVVAEGVKTSTGLGVAKSLYDMSVANRPGNAKNRARMMRAATTDLIRYLGLLGAALLIAALLDDDDYIGSYNTIGRKDYALAKGRNAGSNYIRIGGKWVSLRYLPMINIPISAIMTARQAKKKKKNQFHGYLIGVLGQIMDSPGIKETGKITSNIGYALRSGNLEKMVESMGLDWKSLSDWAKVRAIPSVVSYDVWNQMFPPDKKYDFMGREIEKSSLFKDDKSNDITMEMNRLSDTGNFPVIADPSDKYATMLEEQLGEEEYTKVVAGFKRKYADRVAARINLEGYKRLTDEKKKKAIDKIRKQEITDKIRNMAD